MEDGMEVEERESFPRLSKLVASGPLSLSRFPRIVIGFHFFTVFSSLE